MYKYYKETMDFVDKLDGLTSDQEKEQLFSEWEQWLSDHSVKSMDWAYLMFLCMYYSYVIDEHKIMFDQQHEMLSEYSKMCQGYSEKLRDYEKALNSYCKAFDMFPKLELLHADTSDIPLQ